MVTGLDNLATTIIVSSKEQNSHDGVPHLGDMQLLISPISIVLVNAAFAYIYYWRGSLEQTADQPMWAFRPLGLGAC